MIQGLRRSELKPLGIREACAEESAFDPGHGDYVDIDMEKEVEIGGLGREVTKRGTIGLWFTNN